MRAGKQVVPVRVEPSFTEPGAREEHNYNDPFHSGPNNCPKQLRGASGSRLFVKGQRASGEGLEF